MQKRKTCAVVKKKVVHDSGLNHERFVTLERSDYGHWLLEKAIVDLCAADGILPLTNKHIDLLAKSGGASVIFEVKSCSFDDVGGKVRQAIYQLMEYRFLYRDNLGPDVRLCVVSERRPTGRVGWLMSYLEHLGIGIIWKGDDDSLLCTEFTKKLLADVLSQIARLRSAPDQRIETRT